MSIAIKIGKSSGHMVAGPKPLLYGIKTGKPGRVPPRRGGLSVTSPRPASLRLQASGLSTSIPHAQAAVCTFFLQLCVGVSGVSYSFALLYLLQAYLHNGRIHIRLSSSNVGKIYENVRDIESNVTVIESHVADIESYVTDVESHVADVESHVADVESHVADIESDVADIESHVADIEGHVTDVESHIADIESHVIDI